jgi:hypothetical protein
MESTDLMYTILSLATIIFILISVIVYRSKKTVESDYDKEMKKLRQLLLVGKLDRKSFLHIRDNLKVEDLFGDETQRLDNMLEQKSIDSETHNRMKKILNMTFNEKMEKINLKYNYIDLNLETKNNNIRFPS